MPLRDPAPHMATRSHLADGDRHLTASVLGSPASATPEAVVTPTNVGGGHGVCGDADLRVTPGTGTRVVSVAPGHAFVRGGTNSSQAVYNVWNDAATNVTIDNGDGNPRFDLVAVRVRDSDPGVGNAASDVGFVVIKGTPGAAPTDPAIPTDGSYLVLARVRVPAGSWTTVTTSPSMVDDLRPMSNALGGVRRCRSTNRPSANLSVGDLIYETDTGYVMKWDGSSWRYHGANMYVTPTANAWPTTPTRGEMALNVTTQFPAGVAHFYTGTAWQTVGNVRWSSGSAINSLIGTPGTNTGQRPLIIQAGTAWFPQAGPTMNASGEAPLFWNEPFPNGVAYVQLVIGEANRDVRVEGINSAGAFAGFVPSSRFSLLAYSVTRSGCQARLRLNTGDTPILPSNIRIDFLAVGF